MEKCSSCGTEVMKDYVKFKCPGCGKSNILRCKSCRVLGTTYSCGNCNLQGP
ncbi:MAG: zinc finger domain-containing protein [Methanobacteriota archaeon]